MKIYEIIKPNECYLIEKDDNGILYLGNKNGKTFLAIAKYFGDG